MKKGKLQALSPAEVLDEGTKRVSLMCSSSYADGEAVWAAEEKENDHRKWLSYETDEDATVTDVTDRIVSDLLIDTAHTLLLMTG